MYQQCLLKIKVKQTPSISCVKVFQVAKTFLSKQNQHRHQPPLLLHYPKGRHTKEGGGEIAKTENTILLQSNVSFYSAQFGVDKLLQKGGQLDKTSQRRIKFSNSLFRAEPFKEGLSKLGS